ncbi:MAG TPA: hypothetical protein VGM51_01200 [Armatimonadota bacterium]|jgi:O-antigen/teichoic acid export membrane protein
MSALLARFRTPSLRASLLFLVSSIAFQGARFLITLVGADALGPADFGVWVLVVAVLSYTPYATLGVVNAMNREVPILLGRSRPHEARESEEAALGASLVSAIGLFLLILGVGLVQRSDPWLMFFVAVAVSLQQVVFCYQATLRSRIRFGEAAAQQFVMAGVFLLVSLPALSALGVAGLIAGQSAAWASAAILSAMTLRPDLRASFPVALLRRQIRSGLPIALSGLAFAMLVTQDRWVVAAAGGGQELGLYGFASTVASALLLLLLIIGQQMYPRMGYVYGQRDREAARRLATRQSLLTAALTGTGGIAILAVTAMLVRARLGDFAPSLLPLAILCIAGTILGAASGSTNLLVVIGRAWLLVGVYLTGACSAFAIGLILLISGVGLAGPAIGTLVGAVVVATAATALVRAR